MEIRQSIFAVIVTLFGCSIAMAADMGLITSLQGGYASIDLNGNTQRFTGTDSDLLVYTNSGSHKNIGFAGVFLGVEHLLPLVPNPVFFVQAGAEYNYFGNVNINGLNIVGIEPETSTTYNYNYNLQTQQILGMIKLFATTHEQFHPYVEVGIGAAFNTAKQYNATPTETGSLNLTPSYSNKTNTQFSYGLGLGMDFQVNTNIRVGLGYRHSNFGSASLGKGTVTIDDYQSPVPFTLSNSNIYVNQLMARISYVG